MDLAAARRLFPASQATQPGRQAAVAGDVAAQPTVTPRKRRLQEKFHKKVTEEALSAHQEATARAKRATRASTGAPPHLQVAAKL